MTFNIGRGCAELQILKSENGRTEWTIVMNICIHIDIDDVAQEIVKCYLGLAEALPRFKFWKTVKLALSLDTFWIFW